VYDGGGEAHTMYPVRRKVLISAFKLFDLMAMAVCLFLSVFSVTGGLTVPSLHHFGQIEIKLLNLFFFITALLTWLLILSNFRLYSSRRLSKQTKEISDVFKATSIGTIIIWIEGLFFQIDFITLSVIVVFWVLCTTTTIISRILLRVLLRWFRIHGRNLRHVLIIGTNQRAIKFSEKILSSPELGYRLIGFVDDHWNGLEKANLNGLKLVCDLKNFKTFVRSSVVDEVIIVLPLKSFYDQASRIISICEEQGIHTRYLSSIFANSENTNGSNDSLIPINFATIYGIPSILKRILDLVLAIVFLFLSIPIFIVVPLVIKLTSPGPVFFVQKRVGFGKRIFHLFKFRTMINDAEKKQIELEAINEASGPVFKIKDDPRVTPIGRFLRKTSIDELPQLINVIIGDMSIVGPRPLPVRDYNGFNEDWHRRRFSVRPGLTCLWQIQGRCDISFDKWMELDMEYIDHWSLWLDIKILLKTIPLVFKGVGAA